MQDNWIQPRLMGRGGAFALEMDFEAMQLRLVDLAAGLTTLTFCAPARWPVLDRLFS